MHAGKLSVRTTRCHILKAPWGVFTCCGQIAVVVVIIIIYFKVRGHCTSETGFNYITKNQNQVQNDH